MDNVLKPCPFCGGEAQIWDNGKWEPVMDEGGAYIDCDIQSPDIFGVQCQKCCCQLIGYATEAESIAAWNRRADPESKPLTLDEIILRCTPKAAELLKSGQLGAIKVCAVSESIHPTNADRIRSMNDEELARFLGDEPPYLSTYDKYLEWLKQPVKEESQCPNT